MTHIVPVHVWSKGVKSYSKQEKLALPLCGVVIGLPPFLPFEGDNF